MAIQQQIGKKKSFWKKGVKCTVEGATREADELGGLGITERLQNVVFTEDSFFVTKESTNSENSANKSNKSGKSKKKEKGRYFLHLFSHSMNKENKIQSRILCF